MFERYTELARRVLFFSREEVTFRGHTFIGPEHLLLGLIREHGHVAARVLSAAHVSPELVREVVARATGTASGSWLARFSASTTSRKMHDPSLLHC